MVRIFSRFSSKSKLNGSSKSIEQNQRENDAVNEWPRNQIYGPRTLYDRDEAQLMVGPISMLGLRHKRPALFHQCHRRFTGADDTPRYRAG